MRRRGRGRSGTPQAMHPEGRSAPAVRQSRTRMSRLPPQLTREADERPPVADPVLEIEDLRVRFHLHDHTVRAVDGVNIALGRRETLGIVGESGCGKSVTSLAVMRLIPSPPGKSPAARSACSGATCCDWTSRRCAASAATASR